MGAIPATLIAFGILLALVAMVGGDHAIIEPDDLEDDDDPRPSGLASRDLGEGNRGRRRVAVRPRATVTHPDRDALPDV